jgi:kynurenine formamidase
VTKTGPGWPAPEVPIMNQLLERGVRCVGTDGPSMGSAHDGGPANPKLAAPTTAAGTAR